MAETAIDLDMLNELFDTQKNLDDVFNEDFFLDSSMLFGDNVSDTNTGNISTENDSLDFQFDDDILFDSESKFVHQKSRSVFYFVVPVIIEVAAISYGILYFS